MAFSINPGMDIASGLSYYLFICLFFMICDKFHHDKRVVLPSPKIKLGKNIYIFQTKSLFFSVDNSTNQPNRFNLKIPKLYSFSLGLVAFLVYEFLQIDNHI